MREVNFTPVDEIVDRLRELHVWVEHYNELTCEGCSVGYEGEEPSWPCSTAVLVYEAEEVADALQAAELASKWSRQRWLCIAPDRHRRPRSWLDFWSPDGSIADKVFPRVPVEKQTNLYYRFTKDT